MFRALTCPSSGGQIVLSQHLVSSLSVKGCTVCRMTADCRADDNRCCDNTICPPEDGQVNARKPKPLDFSGVRKILSMPSFGGEVK